MPLSIGVNLRVTGHCNQGGRKYMEDMFSVAYQQSSNDRDLEYAFFGIFDGHGGGEAATFAKENLMDIIVKQKNFWSDNDEDVLKAIRDGYVNTHYAMWRELDKWPRTASGLPSTAGTTASIAFIRKGKIYIGHVGDSGIILGYQEKGDPLWKSKALTRDHKPECGDEMARIQESGGKVVSKSGVPRVVWNRPRLGHKGPVRRSTHIDEIPFLAVARSLGDLWSYNSELNTFVVSPEPDVKVIKIDVKSHRCLIFGTDGLWNMLTPQSAVAIVQAAEKHNEKHLIASQQTGNGQADVHMWINPSKSLVDRALDRWSSTKLRADNTSVVTLMLDPPGPTHSEILLSQKREQMARAPAPPTAQNTEMNSTMNQNIHYPYSNSIHKQHQPSLLESGPNPFHKTPMTSAPPSYSKVQKQPDSSNAFVDGAVSFPNDESNTSDDNSENKYSHSPLKEEKTSNESVIDPVQEEESIQVAEISSSNATEEHNNSTEEIDNSTVSVEVETLVVESSLCVKETSINENNDLEIDEEAAILDTTKFVLERESWLQQVPEAERYPEEAENVDLQPIKFAEPQGPRLRRSVVHETTKKLSTSTNSSSSSFSSSAVMRQTSTCNRRRHSTGAPLNSQRQQQRQRRSLTPKSSTSTGATVSYLSSNNKLKRGAKILLADDGFEEPRVGVGTRNSSLVSLDREPCPKRRTRSEDLRNLHQDENNPANQKVEQQHSRIRWPGSDAARATVVINTSTSGMQERRLSSPNSFKRRSLEKKVTPVKTIRRPSINRSTNRIQMRENFWSDQNRANRTGTNCTGSRRQTVVGIISSMAESVSASTSSAVSVPKRWLRSDTVAATPIKTLRSRNVEITGQTSPVQSAQQYNVVKPNRILESGTTKLKQQANSSSNILTTTSSNSHTPETRTKSTDCSTTPSTRTTPNRTKQNCNITSNVSNNSSCVSLNSSTGSAGSISKRVKTPYNLSARSLSTRSRIKRFSK